MTDHVLLGPSVTQQRLWVLAQLRPGDPCYNVPLAIDLTGPLDPPALARSITEVVRRHEPLRTRFVAEGGEVRQVVDPPAPVPLPVDPVDPADLEARTNDFAWQPFDLTTGPLLRAALLKVSPERHRLLVVVHHIVFDGASAEILLEELTTLYGAYHRGEPSPLPELAVTYADWAARPRPDPEASLRYWTTRMAGASEVMELPITGVRSTSTDYAAGHRTRLIGEAVLAPLRRIAQRRRASMFMLLKAACDVLLHQHGAPEVLMTLALSGRDDADAARLIGYLAKPVVLRTEFADDPTFEELLARVRGDVLDAQEHPDFPLEAVLASLNTPHDGSYYPLNQVMFGYERRPPVRTTAGLTWAADFVRLRTMKLELEITLTETDDGLLAQLGYRTDLFDADTIERMLVRLETLLERIGRDPTTRVSDLIVATEDEWRYVVRELNDTRFDYPRDLLIHHPFQEQVRRTPDAVAVQAGDRQWTYLELDRAANQVARFLAGLGIRPERRVAVCLPRSLELMAVMLGIFKAGGVYVPLDTALPAQRLRTLIQDASVSVVLTDQRFEAMFDGVEAQVVRLETADRWVVGDQPADPVPDTAISSNAAYILYTSGSTGGPKGVVLEHRNLTNIITWALDHLGTELFRSVPLISSLAFDVAMWETFTALYSGGKVVMAEDAFSLGRTTGADTTTVVTAVPSILAELLKLDALPRSARTIFSNGEVLPPSLLRDLSALPWVDTVYNMCAPTETTTFSLYNVVKPGEPIPLGRPMYNTTAYVLDERKRPVPPGVVGELHIGGYGVARGYLDRPGLTADRFIPDPFSTEPGQRLYATGDLVRHAPDGRILFVGRADHQVKLRGCRIELGEVEANLLAHPQVGEACAVVVRAASGDALMAAVAPKPGATVEPSEVRGFLQDRLPGYMVPATITVLPEIPLLPSGKLDRKRVTQLLAEVKPPAEAEEPPVGDAERQVAAAWAEVLGREVGVTRNFFDAGGDSLAMVRLREKLRDTFQRDVHVVDLFRHATIRAMAAYLTGTTGPDDLVRASADRGRQRAGAHRLLAQRRHRS